MHLMTTHERIRRMYEHREADRIPILDYPWKSTLERWRHEGLPKDVSFSDYFDIDHEAGFQVDNSPQYEARIIEDTDLYTIYTTSFGATIKDWKYATSTPQFLDFTIKDRESWNKAKQRISPSRQRVDWNFLKANYKTWREQGAWIEPQLRFGFDVTHSWVVGTERVLVALVEHPEWLMDIFSVMLETNLALLEMVWEEGYHFDSIMWCDDMGYKGHQFFSLKMYRQVLKPFHQRAIDWAHAKGIKARLHSCGDVNPFVPELVNMGLDALNPLEVKAGMDTLYLKKTYGDKLLLHGGINAVYYDQPEKIKEEMMLKIPALKEKGGYIFSSDHSVPDSVSLEDFRGIVQLAKELGSFEAKD